MKTVKFVDVVTVTFSSEVPYAILICLYDNLSLLQKFLRKILLLFAWIKFLGTILRHKHNFFSSQETILHLQNASLVKHAHSSCYFSFSPCQPLTPEILHFQDVTQFLASLVCLITINLKLASHAVCTAC
jgi:hypothetical protein